MSTGASWASLPALLRGRYSAADLRVPTRLVLDARPGPHHAPPRPPHSDAWSSSSCRRGPLRRRREAQFLKNSEDRGHDQPQNVDRTGPTRGSIPSRSGRIASHCSATNRHSGRRDPSASRRRAARGRGARGHPPLAQGRVFVVNYAAILPDEGPGCWPQMPITDGDVPYVRAKQKELNANGPLRRRRTARASDWYRRASARRLQAAGHPLGRAGCAGERRGAAPSEPWRDDRRVGAS